MQETVSWFAMGEKNRNDLFDILRMGPKDCLHEVPVFSAACREGLITRMFAGKTPTQAPTDKGLSLIFDEAEKRSHCQLGSLERLVWEAENMSLPFAVLKGMPLSNELYGCSWARDSRNIDILVSPHDLAKAHAVATKAGFVQPVESFRARQLAEAGSLDRRLLDGMASPYPIRNSVEASHLAQYLKIEDGGSLVALEIHDSYTGMPESLSRQILANVVEVDAGGVRCKVPCESLGFIMLVLAAHEEAEGMRANLSDGLLGARYLFDLKSMLDSRLSLGKVARIVEAYGLRRPMGEALFDLIQVYPEVIGKIENFFPVYRSKWGIGYAKRFVDVESRNRGVTTALNDAVEQEIRDGKSRPDSSSVLIKSLPGQPPKLNAKFRGDDRDCAVTWVVSRSLFGEDDSALVLDSSLLWGANCRNAEELGCAVSVFKQDARWVAKRRGLRPEDFDYPVGKSFGKDVSGRLSVSQRRDTLVVKLPVRLPRGANADKVVAYHAVYAKEVADICRIVAGETCGNALREIVEGATGK